MPESPTTILLVADRAAAYRALHLTLAEALGTRTRTAADHRLARPLAAWSRDHTWHASMWAERFPTVPGADLATATAVAAERCKTLRDALATADDLALWTLVVEQVLPQLAELVAADAARVDADLDAPTARVLTLVLADVRAHRDDAPGLGDDTVGDDTVHSRVVPPVDLAACLAPT